ncbi:MAG: hypothetical protein A2Y62_07815 [Candidatus Fischerbacteria bacterium RBG_13_37_8]|uniref:Putative zinc-finger domain-containing protein n=1 Tax=Candidatus Fischerbacteria bacterium RBG_13_37_8 TaxID=1817863 RepID=A0A1F5V976_9BACT|nr:MAG: hypothetical protein A2Y62_07815 [Candidatus Fischerbacteria bacterium RBG_13_37_8]
MKCNKVQYFIPSFINGTLDEEKKNVIREHLLVCSGCKKYAEALQRQKTVIQQAVKNTPFSESIPEAIKAALSADQKKPFIFTLKRFSTALYHNSKVAIASAAIILLTITTVVVFFMMEKQTQGKLVNLSGQIVCVGCELKKKHNAPCDCGKSGHLYAIKTKEGEYLSFGCAKNIEDMHNAEMKGCIIDAVGYLYPDEHYVHIIAVNSIKKP